MAKIVALTGKAGAGKSTVAAHLEEKHGFKRVRFADPLKNMLRSLYRDAGLDDETIERKIDGDLKEQPCDVLRGRTPRQAMQWLGTEWGRELIAPDFWTELWARRAFPHRLVVVEDCRFDNEAQMVRAAGGILFEVRRPGCAGGAAAGHKSEAGLTGAAAAIVNDGSVADLAAKFDAVVQQVVGGF